MIRKLLAGIAIWGLFASPFLLPKMAYAAETKNVRLIGQSDLQGRDSLQVVLKGNYACIGHPREVGFYIPDPTGTGKSRGPRVIQTNDADLDYRGLIYITDRNGNGLHILQFAK